MICSRVPSKILLVFSRPRGSCGPTYWDAGEYDVLNLILRIKAELKRVGILDDRFVLHFPVEYLIYTDTEKYGPYHFGEMITKWGLPTMKRDSTSSSPFSSCSRTYGIRFILSSFFGNPYLCTSAGRSFLSAPGVQVQRNAEKTRNRKTGKRNHEARRRGRL